MISLKVMGFLIHNHKQNTNIFIVHNVVNIISDKTPPRFTFCLESTVVPTDYRIHQFSSSSLNYEYIDESGDLPKSPESKYSVTIFCCLFHSNKAYMISLLF